MSELVFHEHFVPPCWWDEHPTPVVKAYFKWLTSHVSQLTELLKADVSSMYSEWAPDFSAASVERVERWLELTAAGKIEWKETVLLNEGTEMRAFYAQHTLIILTID